MVTAELVAESPLMTALNRSYGAVKSKQARLVTRNVYGVPALRPVTTVVVTEEATVPVSRHVLPASALTSMRYPRSVRAPLGLRETFVHAANAGACHVTRTPPAAVGAAFKF